MGALLCPAHPSPAPPASARKGRVGGAASATGMFEEGCSVCGGKTWRRRWLPRQAKGAVETDGSAHRALPVCGTARGRLHNSELLPHKQSRLDDSCGRSDDDNNLLLCTIVPARAGHTTTDLLTCCISSFYCLVLIWDFSRCSTPF